jgi:glycosyltransferase involved in cell wall biosynthesis
VQRFLDSNYCKRIVCWSNAGRLSVVNLFKFDSITNKAEVLYPAVPALKLKKRKKNDIVRLLYVSSDFIWKGGLETLKAFRILLEKYDNVELIFKCDVPEYIKSTFDYKEIKFLPYRSQLMPRDELIRKFHMTSDIFVYPTLGDIFGLGLLDAMVAELPIVTTNYFAIPEIVEDGKNGIIINLPYVSYKKNYIPRTVISDFSKMKFPNFIKQIAEKTSILIEDSSLRKEMGRYGRKLVEKGKFSIEERNKRLANIYQEALIR